MSSLADSELFLEIAELAVAFAGFASIASAMRDRADVDNIRVDAGRLTNMIIVSLTTAMLSLVPFIPMLFSVQATTTWRASAFVAIAAVLTAGPGMVERTIRMKNYREFNMQTNVVNYGIAMIAAGAFLACALGYPAGNPAASYATGLVALLLMSAILFFRVIVSLLRPHVPE
ncbi:MAG: hypothetical protein ABIX37_12270 [Gammaproteobacteria bacterium]